MRNCTPENTYKMPEGLVLEPFLTTENDRTSKNIEDAVTRMFEVFGRKTDCKVEPKPKILKDNHQVDTRLAQLGIDNNFKLCKSKDGSVQYNSHEFCVVLCPNTKIDLWIEPAPPGGEPDKTDQELERERERGFNDT